MRRRAPRVPAALLLGPMLLLLTGVGAAAQPAAQSATQCSWAGAFCDLSAGAGAGGPLICGRGRPSNSCKQDADAASPMRQVVFGCAWTPRCP